VIRSLIRKRRPKPRRGEPTPAEKAEVRRQAYERAQGRCELRLDDRCQGAVPWDGEVFVRAHLVHLRARRIHGWSLSNVCIGCYHCHIELAHTKGVRLPKTYEELKAR
jgi:hypothetical protein